MMVLEYYSTDAVREERRENPNTPIAAFTVPSEQVVGVMWFSPFAVTVKQGELFEFIIDWLFREAGQLIDLVAAIHVAVAEAERLGYEIDPIFARYVK